MPRTHTPQPLTDLRMLTDSERTDAWLDWKRCTFHSDAETVAVARQRRASRYSSSPTSSRRVRLCSDCVDKHFPNGGTSCVPEGG